jgi:hypothetical protein
MNPYHAPGARSGQVGPVEDDIAAASPPKFARIAGGAVALAGGVVGLTGVQTLMVLDMRSAYWPFPYALLALGAAHVVLGGVIFRARVWGALCALGGGALLVLASGAWLFVGLAHAYVSLYALASPFVSAAAIVFAALAIGPCQRASAARARLKAQGMSFGI